MLCSFCYKIWKHEIKTETLHYWTNKNPCIIQLIIWSPIRHRQEPIEMHVSFSLSYNLICCIEIQWSSWLEPFQYELWFFILGFINIILLVTWWIDRKSPYGHYRQVDSGDDGFTLLGILLLLFSFLVPTLNLLFSLSLLRYRLFNNINWSHSLVLKLFVFVYLN